MKRVSAVPKKYPALHPLRHAFLRHCIIVSTRETAANCNTIARLFSGQWSDHFNFS